MAFMATIDCFEVSELASKVIPNMAFTLIDEEKSVAALSLHLSLSRSPLHRLVRDQAFKALDLFVNKIKEYTSSMVGSPDQLPRS
jgi:SCY1-like protein 1